MWRDVVSQTGNNNIPLVPIYQTKYSWYFHLILGWAWYYPYKFFFFLILDCEATGTAATPGLLFQPRVIVKMIVEKQMECRLYRGNRTSRRKPAPAPLLSITKSHMTRPGFEPGPPRWEAND
jgi:hypothetical protein